MRAPTCTTAPLSTTVPSPTATLGATRASRCTTVAHPPTVDVSRATASQDRKSTRLNSSHDQISYAVFCLKKKLSYIPHFRRLLRAALNIAHHPNVVQQ